VAVHKRTEEQQKDFIFDIFNKCRNETVSSRLQVNYQILCEQIYIWYKDYIFFDVDNIGLGITEVIKHFIDDNTISEVPQDKDGFFKYLIISIKNKTKELEREFNEKETINIPKEKKRKLREVEDFIRMKESELGRKLTSNEQLESISKWFKKQEYVDLLNVINVGGFSYTSDDGDEEIDVLNYTDTHSENPLDEYITNIDTEIVNKAVKAVLEKKQGRARPCYKALFTLYCIKNNIKELYPILDKEIIDTFHKDGKKPKQYEIYIKYHPKADKKGAEAMASVNLKEFLNDIKTCLEEKNL